ncbi:hypothetical protein DFJ74DRAFT_709988 [Hyaloraphidium curvatum]|nr:hypothetical protein DFJ74DRAFT_709988 [Hyaloraphidium curvatum]
MAAIKTVAVLGGTGFLGRPVVEQLVAAGLNVSVLSRAGAAVPTGAKAVALSDPEDVDEIASLLKGIDAVVSTLPPQAFGLQTAALHAAAKAGTLKLFVLSEFGTDHPTVAPDSPFFAPKRAAKALAEQLGLRWTGIMNGFLSDLLVRMPTFDAAKGTANIPGDGTARITFTSRGDVGRAVAAVLAKADETANRYVRVAGQTVTDNEVLGYYEAVLGKKLAVTHIPVETLKKALEATPSFPVFLAYARATGAAEVSPNEWDKLVGEKAVSVEDFVKATRGGTEYADGWESKVHL